MAPSAALQARIKQFESLSPKHSDADATAYPPRRNAHAQAKQPPDNPSPPDIIGEPVSPTASQFSIIQVSVPYVPRKPRVKSPSPSPPNLGCNTSLIDLKDWVVEDGQVSSSNKGESVSTSTC